MNDAVATARRTLLDERDLVDRDLAERLMAVPDNDLTSLTDLAHEVRLAYCGPEVDVESILSAKTGGCLEDCSFCSQSAHYATDVQTHAMLEPGQVVAAAADAKEAGATAFCIVAAVKGPSERMLAKALDAVQGLLDIGMEPHASLGLLTPEQAGALAAAGVTRYNHNLESCREFFPKVVTTHTWEDRYATCEVAKAAGMSLCSGGILGLGETWEQRLDLAFELRSLGPEEVPVNFLDARDGTPMEGLAHLDPSEALRFLALFRLVLPDVTLRVAGGREATLRSMQATGMLSGVNGGGDCAKSSRIRRSRARKVDVGSGGAARPASRAEV